MRIRTLLSEYVPSLGIYRRKAAAVGARLGAIKQSYSQFGEDVLAMELLADTKPADGCYIDVGANHPTTYSNTYKMYRHGYRGVTIEPNAELVALHRKCRPEDIQIAVGCGVETSILPFSYSKTPVLSSFVRESVSNEWKQEYLPVFRLDELVAALQIESVLFLSVDVEGMDLEVLQGAAETLAKTRVACVEADTEEDRRQVLALMEGCGFRQVAETKCNLLLQKTRQD